MFHGVGSSLLVQSPGLRSPTKTSQAIQRRRQKPRLMMKATLNSQEHKETHTLTKRRGKRKKRTKAGIKKESTIKPINPPINENE